MPARSFLNYKFFTVVTLVGLVGCTEEKVKVVTQTKIEKEYIKPFTTKNTCDRGVDFTGSECDRSVDDRTFWLNKQEVSIKTPRQGLSLTGSKHKVVANVVYEFLPAVDDIGRFYRAIYYTVPDTKRTMGYMESGRVIRVSHNAIDFLIEKTSCGEPPEAKVADHGQPVHFTKYYTRGGNGSLTLMNHIPRNGLEELLFLPFRMIELTVGLIHGLLSTDKAKDVFKQEMILDHYYFKTELLPVEWGCSKDDEFILPPPEYLDFRVQST